MMGREQAVLESTMPIFERKVSFLASRLLRPAAIAVAAMLSISADSAWAQYGMPMMPYVPRSNRTSNNPYTNPNSTLNRNPPQLQGTATITAIGERGLEAVDNSGTNWRVAPEKNCVIQVTGTADPSFLKPDMLVRFTALFDKKGNATAPVNELEIISQQTAVNSIKQELAGKKTDTSGAIIGHIKSIKNNQLAVQTTNGIYSAELASNPSIKVNVSDFRWAQPGDKLDAVVRYLQPGTVSAQEMRITLSSPLGEPGKKKTETKAAGTATTTNK
jgi:hypothetical protein